MYFGFMKYLIFVFVVLTVGVAGATIILMKIGAGELYLNEEITLKNIAAKLSISAIL